MQALLKLSHCQQVIKLVDYFKTKTHYYIVTEYLPDSVDLGQFIKRNKNKFTESEDRNAWRSLLEGMG